MKTLVNAIYVFSVTYVFYVVFFSGIPQTSDEDLFLSTARNIVVHAKIDAPEVYGSTRLQGDYHGVEPAHPVLASLWYRLVVPQLPVGRLQGLYLLPVLYTSLASGLLVILAVQLTYSVRTGVAAGILFGLATIAMPYAKTFYRETLVVFLVLLTWAIFEEVLRNKIYWIRVILIGTTVFLLMLILLTKVALLFFVLSFIVMLILRTSESDQKNLRSIFSIVTIVLVFSILGLGWLFRLQLDQEIFYRFTGTFIKDTMSTFSSTDHGNLGRAIMASLISPWKGFFIYSPICLMIFPSLSKLREKQQIALVVVAVITLTGLALTQVLVYGQGWWTITWSTRHLLPCIPLFIIASLPWIEEAINQPRSTGGICLVMILALGIGIQMGAVIFNSIEYNFLLFEKSKDVYADIMWGNLGVPLWGQWSLFLYGVKPDLTIWRLFQNEKSALLALIGLGLVLAGLFAALWIELYKKQEMPNLSKLSLSLALIAIATTGFMMFYNKDTYYDLQSPQIRNTCIELKERVTKEDIVLIKPYRSRIWFYFMNADCLQYEWYSLPYAIEIRDDPVARQMILRLIDEKAKSAEHVWLVNQVWAEPDELRNKLQRDGFTLKETRNFSFESTKIIFDLYIRDGQ